ncbi:hypothetical protein MMUR_55450 [Mycolicibacterium murale]|uniref:Chemotaxis protein n=1 Tax=Mycolicibacterium murale TaxID=182220 RepID=A0A7I9WV16_9MYCO|nr:DUF4012 domain-containing protein [Mycolicibacterium murale]MCV7185728.1 DUF4012 domain-containing protein [Mycolicibacterium murale]GFG61409.1 hypothetical protein MMUR_55450 [Mycolicibacterium murale]
MGNFDLGIFSRRSVRDSDGDDGDLSDDVDEQRWWQSTAARRALWIGAGLTVLVVVFVAWLGVNAFTAKSSLEEARGSAQKTKDALLQGDTDAASRYAGEAQSHAESARDATHSIPWNIAAGLPWLGSPFKTGQQIANVVEGLATDVLGPSAEVGSVLAPDQLLAGGRLDVRALSAEEPKLSALSETALRLDAEAQSISEPGYISVLADARTQLQDQTHELTSLLHNTTLAARIAPSFMGVDGPRSYFMGFQTNAEARGTGGLLGGFGILRFVDGEPSVDDLGANTELDKAFTPIDLGPEFEKNYGFSKPFTDYRNSNQSAHFPYAAQIWQSMWAQQTGMNVDGVIALDPIALSYILGAVGSITMSDGEVVTKDNVIELTESTAYIRFPDDQRARKQYLQDIATQVVRKVTGDIKSPRELLDALGKAVSERRIAVWSSNPDEQALIEQTPLANVIPDDPAPYAEVVVNNLGGNKMDYYLAREIEYVADGCTGDTRNSTVTVRLTNTIEDIPEPDYIAGTLGFPDQYRGTMPRGTMLSSVRLLATTGAALESVLSNGLRAPTFVSTERNHPSFEVQLAIPPGETAELTFRLTEPTTAGAARVPVQPLVDNLAPTISVPECS